MAVMFPKNINELDPQDSELEVYNQFRKQLDAEAIPAFE